MSFFENLKESVEKKKQYPPANIVNMYETGFSTVRKPVKVVATKGERTVDKIKAVREARILLRSVPWHLVVIICL